MHVSTRVFVSATSGDLASVRQSVKESLLSMDCHPVEQTNFPPDYQTVEQVLEEKIASCQAVVHIVGTRYGAEPDPAHLPAGEPRRSFTQMEADIARRLNKKLYVFLCPTDFTYDESEPEPTELQSLQQQYRQTITADPHLRCEVASREAINLRVREMQLELAELRTQVQKTGRRIVVGVAAVAILLAVIGGAIWWLNRDVEQVGDDVKDIAKDIEQLPGKTADELAKLYDDPQALAERMREGIREKAGTELAVAKERGAKWQDIRELERRRDRALEQVDDVIRTIKNGLTDNPDATFREASRILAEEGVESALGYLASHQEDILARVDKLAAREADLRKQKRKALEPVLLQAELQETNLNWDEALRLYQSVADRAPQWSYARQQLGSLLDQLVRYADAEPHLQAAYQYAEDDASRLRTSNALGLLYLHIADWNRSEPLLQEHLALCEKLHGSDATETATAVNNLAQLYQSTNRLADAERLMRRSLAINEKHFGPKHPDITTSLGNLASLLHYLNRMDEAAPLMRRALAINETTLGPAHPNIATDLNNLAQLVQDQGHVETAELLMRRALAIAEKAYGSDHPNLTVNLGNFANLLKVTGRPAEAEGLLRQAFAIDEQALGPDHPQVAVRLNNLAQLLQVTDRMDKAEPLFRRALAITEKANGPTHASTAIRMNNLAALLHATGRSDQAVPLMRGSVLSEIQTFGADKPKVAVSTNNLGFVLCAAKRPATSEAVLRHALSIMEPTYGTESPDVAVALNALSGVLRDTEQFEKAEPIARRVVVIFRRYKQVTGEVHPFLNIAIDNYLSLLAALNTPDAAIEEKVNAIAAVKDKLDSFLPDLEKLLGPAQSIDDAFAALDEQYNGENKPPVYTLPADQPITPHLDGLLGESKLAAALDQPIASELRDMLGLAPTIKEVISKLDAQYREQNKPAVWFLPLDEPISPHLDSLLKAVK